MANYIDEDAVVPIRSNLPPVPPRKEFVPMSSMDLRRVTGLQRPNPADYTALIQRINYENMLQAGYSPKFAEMRARELPLASDMTQWQKPTLLDTLRNFSLLRKMF